MPQVIERVGGIPGQEIRHTLGANDHRDTSDRVSGCGNRLPDVTVQDLRVGKHNIDIHFWREGEQTAFKIIKGDPELVERCKVESKFAELRTGSDPI